MIRLALVVVIVLGLVLTVLAVDSSSEAVAWAAGGITVGSIIALKPWRA